MRLHPVEFQGGINELSAQAETALSRELERRHNLAVGAVLLMPRRSRVSIASLGGS
jgi:hypothetical protein